MDDYWFFCYWLLNEDWFWDNWLLFLKGALYFDNDLLLTNDELLSSSLLWFLSVTLEPSPIFDKLSTREFCISWLLFNVYKYKFIKSGLSFITLTILSYPIISTKISKTYEASPLTLLLGSFKNSIAHKKIYLKYFVVYWYFSINETIKFNFNTVYCGVTLVVCLCFISFCTRYCIVKKPIIPSMR